jgi:hypothetical protein
MEPQIDIFRAIVPMTQCHRWDQIPANIAVSVPTLKSSYLSEDVVLLNVVLLNFVLVDVVLLNLVCQQCSPDRQDQVKYIHQQNDT